MTPLFSPSSFPFPGVFGVYLRFFTMRVSHLPKHFSVFRFSFPLPFPNPPSGGRSPQLFQCAGLMLFCTPDAHPRSFRFSPFFCLWTLQPWPGPALFPQKQFGMGFPIAPPWPVNLAPPPRARFWSAPPLCVCPSLNPLVWPVFVLMCPPSPPFSKYKFKVLVYWLEYWLLKLQDPKLPFQS